MYQEQSKTSRRAPGRSRRGFLSTLLLIAVTLLVV